MLLNAACRRKQRQVEMQLKELGEEGLEVNVSMRSE